MVKPKYIDSYIAAAPKEARGKLHHLCACVRSSAPGATESLKWSMPAFSYQRILVTFAAFTHHIGFYPTPSVLKAFAKDLSRYKTGRGSIQFPLDTALPLLLIRKMVAFRAREVREKDKRWM